MKKHIIILIAFLSFLKITAQEPIVPLPQQGIFDGDDDTYYYYKDVNGDLNKFIGTWKYQDADKELIITGYLKPHVYSGGNYCDDVYFKFKYTDAGTVVYNTLTESSIASEKIIYGCSISPDKLNIVRLMYREPTNLPFGAAKKYGRLSLEYLPCTTIGCDPQLNWTINWHTNRDTDLWPWKIPKNLTLTKQP